MVYQWYTNYINGIPMVYQILAGIEDEYKWYTNGIPLVYQWYTNGIPSTTIRNKKRETKKSRRASETLAYFFLVQTPNSILNKYQVVPMVYQVILFS